MLAAVRPRILYVVTEDWYFVSHRLPMARAAREAGFEVHVATNIADGEPAIRAECFVPHPMNFARGRLSPMASLSSIRALRRLYRELRPELIHHVAVQPVALGSIAALGLGIPCVNAVTGLGYAFISNSVQARIVRLLLSAALRLLLAHTSSIVLVQNDDDRALLAAQGIPPDRMTLIPGSGIDVTALTPLPEPPPPVTVAFVGRLLQQKGIRAVLKAHALLRSRGSDMALLIAGTPDPANPTSLTDAEVADMASMPGVTWLGHVRDIATVWARAHIAVLPSWHEGLPKALLEAAACGRPMVATDAAGCREVVRPGETGILVPVEDPEALAGAIATLAADPALRARYGTAARRLAVERFSADAIGRQTVDLYRRLVSVPGGT